MKTIPSNQEAEKAVLCAVLLDNSVLHTIKEILSPDDFFSPRHRAIFQAMLSLDGGLVDKITLRQAMEDLEKWEDGCEAYLPELAGFTSTSAGARHHANMIKESSIKRARYEDLEGELEKLKQDGVRGKANKAAPTMAELREYMDLNIQPGQCFTSEDVCKGLGAFTREHKKFVYTHISRLVQEGIIRKDRYRHGGFRRVLKISAYDLSGAVAPVEIMKLKLPLDLHSLIKIQKGQLIAVSGRYDGGKSSFLFHTMSLNYHTHKVIHFSSPEWEPDAIKVRLDDLKIPRPHENVLCYPMEEGYEDLIPREPCIILVDYIRTDRDPRDIDRQFNRILENLHGGVALCAIQKHPGLDKPTGGQFAVHAPHHVILMDKWNQKFLCKIFKTKNEKNLEGYFRLFGFKENRLYPVSDNWKRGEIKWSFPEATKDANDSNDNEDNEDNEDNKNDQK